MRLIDADALKSECRDIIQNYETRGDDYGIGKCGGMTQAMDEIDWATTIPAIPVDWIRKYADTVGSRVRAEIVREMLDVWEKEKEG